MDLPSLPLRSSEQTSQIPDYLQRYYRWAYVAPSAIRFWDHTSLVQGILFGQYNHLKQAAITALDQSIPGDLLQTACVYGNLTANLLRHLRRHESLTVVDVVPDQLSKLADKISSDHLQLECCDSSHLPWSSAQFTRNLMFFLLHEQPREVRNQTIAEGLRVLKPGGSLVIIDYHRPPRWHPLYGLICLVFALLEPFAYDLWQQDLATWIPSQWPSVHIEKTTYFAGLYQRLVIRIPLVDEPVALANDA
ncbi:MAG: methyltransferase domain-containing protein [Pseudomonadales bacterium]|nr:methyltransferase domain-containing protein [Pseudomonadales bacterium]